MNLIWNAAGDYDLDSPFLAFHPNGAPDPYFNIVIGLTARWFSLSRIADFFDRLGTGPTADEAGALLWLGIEHSVYGKELPQRPQLAHLRRRRAEEFFSLSGMLSEQQMMLQSMKVYEQEEVRWSEVLGKRGPVLTPRASRLAQDLRFSPDLDTDALLEKMKEILQKHFRIDLAGRTGAGSGRHALAGLLSRMRPAGQDRTADLLVLRRGTGSGDHKRSVHVSHGLSVPGAKAPEKDRGYIEEAFGRCRFSDAEMRILEENLCRDEDENCRLWITAPLRPGQAGGGSPSAGEGADGRSPGNSAKEKRSTRESRRLAEDRQAQRRRNEAFFQKNSFRIRENVRNLSAQMETLLASFLKPLPAASVRGRADAARIWRLPVLHDLKVMQSDSGEHSYTLTVDLLLDASQSRMNSQEEIAAQGYVIARSLEECHIPVRVTAFRSLRGYTVLEQLKDYGERTCRGLFGYYAGGWNRDGLALKTMEYLMEEERKAGNAGNRLLLVLTDASPNDSVPLPPKQGGRLPRAYEGDAAVEPAAEAVGKLRSAGITTAAVYYGAAAHLDNVHQIYGQQYVRILNFNQLSGAVGELLRRSLND